MWAGYAGAMWAHKWNTAKSNNIDAKALAA
jgi:hypothetical protein